jgi:hypothetical protein
VVKKPPLTNDLELTQYFHWINIRLLAQRWSSADPTAERAGSVETTS